MKSTSGQILIEVIIASLVIIMVSLAIGQLITASIRGTATTLANGSATFLSGEEVDSIRAVAREDWHNVSNLSTSSANLYHTVQSGGKWTIASSSEVVTLNNIAYTRSFYLSDIYRSTSTGNIVTSGGYYDPSTVKVNVALSWTNAASLPFTFTQVEYLSRYLNQTYAQTDWSGGSVGDVVTSVATTTFATSSFADTNGTPGSVQLLTQGGSITGIAHVQTKGGIDLSGTDVTVNLSSTVAGDTLLVGFEWSAATTTYPKPTDTKGDTFVTIATSTISGNNGPVAIYAAYNIAAGNTTTTISGWPFGNGHMVVSEYSGLASSNAFDKYSSFDNGFGASSPFTSNAASTTSQSKELLWGFFTDYFGNVTDWSSGGGFTGRATSSDAGSFVEDNIVSSAGAYAATSSAVNAGSDEIWGGITTWHQ